jgi:hypothetical protein
MPSIYKQWDESRKAYIQIYHGLMENTPADGITRYEVYGDSLLWRVELFTDQRKAKEIWRAKFQYEAIFHFTHPAGKAKLNKAVVTHIVNRYVIDCPEVHMF